MSTDFDDSPGKVGSVLKENNLEVAGILVNTFSRKWKLGFLFNRNESLRNEAVEEVRRTGEISNELECDDLTLWLGSDGFDYPFRWTIKDSGLSSWKQ
jgi:L-rhamnose isomerase